MAYERYNDNEDPADALRQQLEGQMQKQPMGAPSALGAAPSMGGIGYKPEMPEMALSQADADFRSKQMGVQSNASGQTPLMERVQVGRGANGEVTMDQVPAATQPAKPPSPMGGGAMARYGTGDIADAAGLKTGGYGGEGFSYNERAARGERGADTIKNSFGKIASRYDPTQAGATKSVMADPDFQRLFPEAKIIEHPNGDMIDFGDGKPVDVLRAARAGGAGEAWQWGADDGMGGGAGGAGGMNLNQMVLGGGGDPMAAIQAQLSELSGGGAQDEQTLIQQLLAQQGI